MIHARDLCKTFIRGTREVRALDGVSFDVARGELIAIMGPSGSGKSTLLHLLGAMEPPTGGELTLDGVSVPGLKEEGLTALRRDRLGFVFQFFNLLPTMTARENVMLPLLLTGVRREAAQARADELLLRVDLAGRGDHHVDELSGGEMQRVAVARALVKRPALLLADEPTGNLDSGSGARLLQLLSALRQDGLTLVIGTHDAAVSRIADRTLHLRDGRFEEPSSSAAAR